LDSARKTREEIMTTKLFYENVYGADGAPTPLALAILYTHLEVRTPQQNISHKEMPTWPNHEAFVRARPYKEWWLIFLPEVWEEEDGTKDAAWNCVGQIYLTKANEIGIHFLPQYCRKGYGEEVAQWLIEKVRKGPFLANINPENKASIAFFEKLGFTLLQHTYILNPQFFDEEPGDEPKRLVGGARFDETPFE
jgi:RimJ/RimL family protein N-acetyltransferase